MANKKLAKTTPAAKKKTLDPQQLFQAHWETVSVLSQKIAALEQQAALLARFRLD